MPTLANRVKNTITAVAGSGQGTLTLGAAVDGFQSMADKIATGTNVRYSIEGPNDLWEIGQGTFTTSGATLTRTPSESSSGGAAITATTDSVVFITATAADLQPAIHNSNTQLVAQTGMSIGDLAMVTSQNKLYIYTATGWFLVATLTNSAPSAITGANAEYTIPKNGTPVVVTLTATDPEGFPISFTHTVSTGSLGSTATVTQGTGTNSNVFTIQGSTNPAHAGTFSLTFSASDGNSVSQAISAFELTFFAYEELFTKKGPSASSSNAEEYGSAVATNGTYSVVTAPNYDNDGEGVVYCYDTITGNAISNWNPRRTQYSSNRFWGSDVALSNNNVLCISRTPTTTTRNTIEFYDLPSTSVQYTRNSPVSSLTSDKFGKRIRISPNGNYLAVGKHDYDYRSTNYHLGRIYVYAGQDFTDAGGTSHSRGGLIHSPQGAASSNYSYSGVAKGERLGFDLDVNNDYLLGCGPNWGSTADQQGRYRLWSLSTGTEVTSGVWPVEGLASYGFIQAGRLTSTHAILMFRKQSSGTEQAYIQVIKLSDHSLERTITSTGSGSEATMKADSGLAVSDTHIFVGSWMKTGTDSNTYWGAGAAHIYNISTGALYTPNSEWPIEGGGSKGNYNFRDQETGNRMNRTLDYRNGSLVYGNYQDKSLDGTNRNGALGIIG